MTQDRRITDKLPGHPLQWDDSASPSAAPAAGQAGLAKPHENEALRDAVTNGLRGLWGCGRVWSAWNVGTMGEEDFYAADESEECIDQVIDALAPFFAILAAPVAADTEQASKDAEDLIAAATQLREVPHWAAQASVSLLAEIAGRMLKAAPLATPADAGAGDEHPHKADAAELSIAQVVERLRRDAAGGLACNVFELDRAADLLESLARLSTSGAPAPEGTVTLCQYSSFGPWIECDPSDEKAVKFAPVRQSPAPVTAEPSAQQIKSTDDARKFVDEWHKKHFPTDRTFTNYIMGRDKHCALAGDFAWQLANALNSMAATTAPADRDAIRDQALEEAAEICENNISQCCQTAEHCAEDIRALKSMERAADAKGGA